MNTFNAPITQINAIESMTTVKSNKSVDLGGYVIIVVQTEDKKIQLYGSPPAGRLDDLELSDEITAVNETKVEDMSRTQVLELIHEGISSSFVKLSVVKRQCESKSLSDIGNIQDAFYIAMEDQARQRLQRHPDLKEVNLVDMSKLSVEIRRGKLSQIEKRAELNGYIANNDSTIFVSSINEIGATESIPIISSPKFQPKSLPAKPIPVIVNGIDKKIDGIDKKIDGIDKKRDDEEEKKDISEKSVSKVTSDIEVLKSDAFSVVREQLSNGRCEKLLGEQPDHRARTSPAVENNKLVPGGDRSHLRKLKKAGECS